MTTIDVKTEIVALGLLPSVTTSSHSYRLTMTPNADDVRFPDQRSLTDQMVDLYSLAVEKGLYDACDWLSRTFFGTGLLGPSNGEKLTQDDGTSDSLKGGDAIGRDAKG